MSKNRAQRVYSYIRFSNPEQELGDSERRQISAHLAWAKRNGLPLDTSLGVDRGLSGYTGENIDRGALGQFVLAVMRGDVARGSVLLLDTFDRFTRQDEQTSVFLLLTLTRAGVKIVRLNPSELTFDDKSDFGTFVSVLVDVSRSHGESKTKSSFISRAKQNARDAARQGVKVRQRHPDWLRWEDGRWCEREDRCEIVRRAWRMRADGHSYVSIATAFNADGLVTFRRGKPWNQSAVCGLFVGRQALGRYQPRTADRVPQGAPIDDFYPRVVPTDVAARVLAVAADHGRDKGRVRECVNVFAGLLFEACQADGLLSARPERTRSGRRWYSLSRSFARGSGTPRLSLPYAPFERAVLSRLVELKAADLEHDQADDVEALQSLLSDARARSRAVATAVASRPSETLIAAARAVDDEVADLAARLEDAQRRRMISPPDDLAACQAVIRSLEAGPDSKGQRIALRTRLRAVVQRIDVVIQPRGQIRLAVAQVRFQGGTRRDYLLAFRRELHHRDGAKHPARRAVRSLPWHPGDDAPAVDLTNAAHVEALKAWLAALDVAALPWQDDE